MKKFFSIIILFLLLTSCVTANTEKSVVYKSNKTETVSIYIYNPVGQLVKTVTFNCQKGTNTLNINGEIPMKGVYFIKVVGQEDAPYWTKEVVIELN